ncbi:MAG: heme ABC exporter ATP-binding protein CcmA [Methyloligellaceae bacterium]
MKLTARNLALERGGRTLFDGLSFTVPAGSGLLLRGANGAGKSSLLRALAGFLPVREGTIRLEGGAEDLPVGEQCHYVGHLNGVKRALAVRENLEFWGRYLGGGDVGAALDSFRLAALADVPAGLLSAGQSRRLGLARLALVHRPLWLLDEPSVSLDADSVKILAGAIRAHLKAGGIVVAATHAPLGLSFRQTLVLGEGGKAPRAGAAA